MVEKARNNPRNKTRNKILELIEKNKDITTKELSEKLKLAAKNIEWHIQVLKNENIIERVGSKKTGSWKIKD